MFREKTLFRDTNVYKLGSAIIAHPTEGSKEKRNLNKSRWCFFIEVLHADENIKTFRNIFQCQVKILRCVPSSLPRNFIPKLFYKYYAIALIFLRYGIISTNILIISRYN